MDVLVVGSGGREHALVWKLASSPEVGELHAAPGNPGIAGLATCHPLRPEDGESLLSFCRSREIDLVVVGPEAPLVAGVADVLRHGGVRVLGPGAQAARIEGSKAFAKEVMRAAGVPTAAALDLPRAPCVIKADGLAAGKGVFVCRTQAEAEEAFEKARAFGGSVVVEELLEGEELSVFALTDGVEAVALPSARDAKRLLDGDEGPNTGGMGAYAPVPGFGADETTDLVERIHKPVLAELARRGTPFVGLLYAGLMLTEDGPRVLEFNCRFGDPETQAVLPVIGDDLLEAFTRAADGDLAGVELTEPERAAVTVVVASPGYPGCAHDRRADRRTRRRRGRRRARLPCGHRAARRRARLRRRARARDHRCRRDARGCARARLRRRRLDPTRRRPVQERHRGGRDPCHELKPT